MILGIDAFNLIRGGGITHLVELLRAANPPRHGFERVVLWGGTTTLAMVEDRPWLNKIHEPLLDCGLPWRIFWHRLLERRRARAAGCDIVFLPGGTAASGFSPVVTMSRNMLPFEWREWRRYGWSVISLKLLLLRYTQARSLVKADGVIFLTQYARNVVCPIAGLEASRVTTIPHGISRRFFHPPRVPQRELFTPENPCRILYVSIISPYKHQWHVVDAVARLRAEGLPVVLELIGPTDISIGRLREAIGRADPDGAFVFTRGAVAHEALERCFAEADIGLFASSCENMPNILLESMAAGLPMACSGMGPMPEILGDAGEYFDPLDPVDIADALRRLIKAPRLRDKYAQDAYRRAKKYSWERCANDTLAFLADVAKQKVLRGT
jgi:glycosyltransferase involved in cell wall biosynthesis